MIYDTNDNDADTDNVDKVNSAIDCDDHDNDKELTMIFNLPLRRFIRR